MVTSLVERDEYEVKGYYAALAHLEQYAAQGVSVTEKIIQTLHALVMSDGRTRVISTPYRDGQNVIKDGATNTIGYKNLLKKFWPMRQSTPAKLSLLKYVT